jgi:hypothetical protein
VSTTIFAHRCTALALRRWWSALVEGRAPFTALTLAEFACIGRRRWRRCTTVIADSCPTVVGGRLGAPSPFIALKSSYFTWRSRGRRWRYAMNIQHQISVLKCICICTTEGRASVIRQADMRMPQGSRHHAMAPSTVTQPCSTLWLMSFLAQLTSRFLWGERIILSTTGWCLGLTTDTNW